MICHNVVFITCCLGMVFGGTVDVPDIKNAFSGENKNNLKINKDVFSEFKKSVKLGSKEVFGPGQVLDLCVQFKKKENYLNEALGHCLLLAEYPEAGETKLILKIVEADMICCNLVYLFNLNCLVNDKEIWEINLKAIRNYSRVTRIFARDSTILPILAIVDPGIDPKKINHDDFPEEDREVFKILLSNQSAYSKGKKIFQSNHNSKCYFILYMMEFIKDKELASDKKVLVPLARFLLDGCQFGLAAKVLENVVDGADDFHYQFLKGWAAALNGDPVRAGAIFDSAAQGSFTEAEIQAALDSARIVKNQKNSKDMALREIGSFVDHIVKINPSSLSFNFSYPTEQGKFMHGDCLISPGLNKVEFSIFSGKNLFYYQDTSIFGTKIKADCSDFLFKNDIQVLFPYYESKSKINNWRSLYSYYLSTMNENPFVMKPFSQWNRFLDLIGTPKARQEFLDEAYEKGFFFELTTTNDGKTLEMITPKFDSPRIVKCGIAINKNNRVISYKSETFSANNIQYGDKMDEKFVERGLPDLKVSYKSASEIHKAALYLLKYEPKFGSVYGDDQ